MSSLELTTAIRARTKGLFLSPDEVADPWVFLCLDGPDAGTFLHSQTTNDVLALAVGEGHVGARVTRTGHLVSLFSCHRLHSDRGEQYGLVVQQSQREALFEALDAMHFSDDFVFDYPNRGAGVLQGPKALSQLSELDDEWAAIDWENVAECAEVRVGEHRVIRRSLTGDPGFLIWSDDAEFWELLRARVSKDDVVTGSVANLALETLRLEAGWPKMGPDTLKKRLLPEFGLEQQAVSYTKGCYLGQEVIARVRTYGSLPKALRMVVFELHRKGIDFTLEQIPAAGEEVVAADGSKVGFWGSRGLSPVEEKPFAFAYLNKQIRTPGAALTIWGNRGPMKATVRMAPLYTSADREARVAYLYDLAIRTFADGREDEAMRHLEEALRLNPGFADGYETIGVIFGRQGKFHEAIDFFRRLEEVAPLEPMVNTNLSLYYMKLGDKETAEHQSALAAQKAMRGNREGVDAAAVAKAQAEARRADAVRKKGMFEQVLEFDPADPIALFGMGTALGVLGDWERAVEHLKRASEVDRRNSAVYLAWGKALEALERTQEALEVFQAGMDIASSRGDLMPLKEMENRVLLLKATGGSGT